MKIMHGMREVAGQAYYSVKGLRESSYDATLILWDESPAKYPYDHCMKMDQKKKYMYPVYGVRVFVNFLKCAFKYDTFHFHFGHSLLPKNLDLPFLKAMKKDMFFEFHGSDIRQKSIALQQNRFWEKNPPTNEEKLIKRANKLKKYAKGFIIHDDELIPHMPENTNVYVVPLRMDTERFEYRYPDRNKDKEITIVHAPSNRGAKGTEYVNAAIEKLQQKYSIKYELVEGLTQEEAFKKYIDADIIVDQLVIGTYGVFSIESMMMGKPVLVFISEEMVKRLPEELPLVNASPDDVEKKLELLIKDGAAREQLGREGREYAMKYHDCKKNGAYLGRIYEGKEKPVRGRDAFFAVSGDKEEQHEVY